MSPTWYFFIIAIVVLISIIIIIGTRAVKKVNFNFEKYSDYKANCESDVEGLAAILISKANLPIQIVKVNSNNSNIYSSKYKVLKLSNEFSKSVSIVSIAKVSHEIGHAIQDNQKRLFFRLKTALLPIINIMLISFIPLFLLGLALAFSFNLNLLGLIVTIISFCCLAISLVFYLVTIISVNKSSEEVCFVLDKLNFYTENELFVIKTLIYANSSNYLYDMVKYLFFFIYSFTN